MIQSGYFDPEDRVRKIVKNGDPLSKINETVNWELFRPVLEKVRDRDRPSSVGPTKGCDVFCCSRFSSCSRCTICRMMRPSFRCAAGILLAVFLVCTSACCRASWANFQDSLNVSVSNDRFVPLVFFHRSPESLTVLPVDKAA